MQTDWPFDDPKNVAVFTVRQIMLDGRPILMVVHHSEDGSWEFLTGDALSLDDLLLVSLRSVVEKDSTIRDLADLPLGWRAVRESPDSPWVREPDPDHSD